MLLFNGSWKFFELGGHLKCAKVLVGCCVGNVAAKWISESREMKGN